MQRVQGLAESQPTLDLVQGIQAFRTFLRPYINLSYLEFILFTECTIQKKKKKSTGTQRNHFWNEFRGRKKRKKA
jgi:hypothetical protein